MLVAITLYGFNSLNRSATPYCLFIYHFIFRLYVQFMKKGKKCVAYKVFFSFVLNPRPIELHSYFRCTLFVNALFKGLTITIRKMKPV